MGVQMIMNNWKVLEKELIGKKVKLYRNNDAVFPIHNQNLKLLDEIKLVYIKIIATIKEQKDGYLIINQKSIICTRNREVNLSKKPWLVRGEDISTYTGDILHKELERLGVKYGEG